MKKLHVMLGCIALAATACCFAACGEKPETEPKYTATLTGGLTFADNSTSAEFKKEEVLPELTYSGQREGLKGVYDTQTGQVVAKWMESGGYSGIFWNNDFTMPENAITLAPYFASSANVSFAEAQTWYDNTSATFTKTYGIANDEEILNVKSADTLAAESGVRFVSPFDRSERAYTAKYTISNNSQTQLDITIYQVNQDIEDRDYCQNATLSAGETKDVSVHFYYQTTNPCLYSYFVFNSEAQGLDINVALSVEEYDANILTLSRGLEFEDGTTQKLIAVGETLPDISYVGDDGRQLAGFVDSDGTPVFTDNRTMVAQNLTISPAFSDYKLTLTNNLQFEDGTTEKFVVGESEIPAVVYVGENADKFAGYYNVSDNLVVFKNSNNMPAHDITIAPYFAEVGDLTFANNVQGLNGINLSSRMLNTVINDRLGMKLITPEITEGMAFRSQVSYNVLANTTYVATYTFINYGRETVEFYVSQINTGKAHDEATKQFVEVAAGQTVDVVIEFTFATGNTNALTFLSYKSTHANGLNMGVIMNIVEKPVEETPEEGEYYTLTLGEDLTFEDGTTSARLEEGASIPAVLYTGSRTELIGIYNPENGAIVASYSDGAFAFNLSMPAEEVVFKAYFKNEGDLTFGANVKSAGSESIDLSGRVSRGTAVEGTEATMLVAPAITANMAFRSQVSFAVAANTTYIATYTFHNYGTEDITISISQINTGTAHDEATKQTVVIPAGQTTTVAIEFSFASSNKNALTFISFESAHASGVRIGIAMNIAEKPAAEA